MATSTPTVIQPLPFIQAKNYHPGRRSPIELLLAHDMEAARTMTTALHVAQWFAGPVAPIASAHECIDRAEVVLCVRDGDTAWAAPGANDNGYHFELAGFAKDTREQWLEDIHELELAASRFALKCVEHNIPVTFLDAAALAPYVTKDARGYNVIRGIRGITTHWEVTKATRLLGGHTDPGVGFCVAEFMQMVNNAIPTTGFSP